MIAARTSHHPSSAAADARIADLVALDRLGEAMADAIEAALIDAGVDVS